MLDAFAARLSDDPEAEALRTLDASGAVRSWSRRALDQRARALAAGLRRLAPEPGARCIIISEARAEWVVADLGCAMAGLISVPLFPNVGPDMLARVLIATECRIAIVENPWQARKLMDAAARATAMRADLGRTHEAMQIVLMDEVLVLSSGATSSLDEVNQVSDGVRARIRSLESLSIGPLWQPAESDEKDPEACVTLCYTPGTEGAEKGVLWTHATMTALAALLGSAVSGLEALNAPKRQKAKVPSVWVLAVPLAQALGRAFMWTCLSSGRVLALPRSDATVVEDAARLLPTVVVGVPSFYERMRHAAAQEVRARGALSALAARWADAPREKSPSGLLRLRDALAERVMRPALAKRFGPNAAVFVSGGAPLRDGVQDFYRRCGLPLRECYGLVETSAVTHVDTSPEPAQGTVGRPLPGVEQRLGPDGELFVRGPQVSPGYWRDAEATRRVFDAGWFATGDLATLEPEPEGKGRLVITGRKREIIVLNNGRTLAPSPIEQRLMADPLVSQAFVHGEQRDFVSVLLTLAQDELRTFAEQHGLVHGGFDAVALSRHPRVHAHLDALINEINGFFPPHARIKKFAVLTAELAPGDGLTPTGTLQRNVAAERFRPLLDSFYAEPF